MGHVHEQCNDSSGDVTEIFSVQVYGEYLIGVTQKFDEQSEDTPSIELLRTDAEVQRDLAWEALERELNPVEITEDMVAQ